MTKQILGYEALLRGPNNESPGDVLAAAKRRNRLLETDLSSFETAIAGAPPGIVFVNLYPATLLSIASNKRITRHMRLRKPGEVCIELVEVASIRHIFTQIQEAVKVMRDAGFLLAVDDISSGNDRLRLITELAPEYLKIDRPLVHRCHEYPNRLYAIHRMVQLASDLGAGVIAEGIETREELFAVDDQGVIYGQGFLLGRPAKYANSSDRADHIASF